MENARGEAGVLSIFHSGSDAAAVRTIETICKDYMAVQMEGLWGWCRVLSTSGGSPRTLHALSKLSRWQVVEQSPYKQIGPVIP